MVTYVLPHIVIEVREYLAADGTSPYASGLITSMLKLLQKWQPQSREWHKVIYQMQRALALEFKNIASILGLVIESILVGTVTVW
jgi:hypothetical protein